MPKVRNSCADCQLDVGDGFSSGNALWLVELMLDFVRSQSDGSES